MSYISKKPKFALEGAVSVSSSHVIAVADRYMNRFQGIINHYGLFYRSGVTPPNNSAGIVIDRELFHDNKGSHYLYGVSIGGLFFLVEEKGLKSL